MKSKIQGFLRILIKWSYWVLSAEWIFNVTRKGNGGAIIFFRAFFVSFGIFAVMLFSYHYCHCSQGTISDFIRKTPVQGFFDRLLFESCDHCKWFGWLYAGIYTALYTRFASQWSYLSNLYNQIMGAQATCYSASSQEQRMRSMDIIHVWLAAYIEDAFALHLAEKTPVKHFIFLTLQQFPAVRSDLVNGADSRSLKEIRAYLNESFDNYEYCMTKEIRDDLILKIDQGILERDGKL